MTRFGREMMKYVFGALALLGAPVLVFMLGADARPDGAAAPAPVSDTAAAAGEAAREPTERKPMEYVVKRAETTPELKGRWDGPAWKDANVVEIAIARPESSHPLPKTRAKLLFDDETLYGIFRVEDRYVRAVAEKFRDPVSKDSCVEAFLQPKGAGYMNFEFSANGVKLIRHKVHPDGIPGDTSKPYVEKGTVTPEEGERVRVYHSLPDRVDPEITEPVTWVLEFAIPLDLMEAHVGPIGSPAGQSWRGNFYKVAVDVSHPHYISWAPLGRTNFHRPQDFATVRFEE
jgi:hypothetical protein